MAERRARTKTPSREATPRAESAEVSHTSEEDAAARLARLQTGVARLRIRGWSMDVPRLMMVGGGVLLLLGLTFIGAAWWGAAHTPYLFEQVPYLISGGLLGLGLTFVGGAFYFAYWMTRQVQETKRQASSMEEALGRIERALLDGPTRPGVAGAPPASNGSFVATAKGTMFHKPDCPVVAGRSDLKRVSADAKGLEPCRMCDPLAEAAPA